MGTDGQDGRIFALMNLPPASDVLQATPADGRHSSTVEGDTLTSLRDRYCAAMDVPTEGNITGISKDACSMCVVPLARRPTCRVYKSSYYYGGLISWRQEGV